MHYHEVLLSRLILVTMFNFCTNKRKSFRLCTLPSRDHTAQLNNVVLALFETCFSTRNWETKMCPWECKTCYNLYTC